MRVAIDRGPLESGHSVRGVGANTRELIKAIKKLNDKNIKLFDVDFDKTDLTNYNLVHYQYFHPYLSTLPDKLPTKTILTIHDLIPLVYPKHYPAGLRGKLRFMLLKNRLKSINAITTISETSKKDIVRFLKVPADKVHVTYLGPSESFSPVRDNKKLKKTRDKYNLPLKFVLYVGDVNYNKNLPTLIKACEIAHIALVICGKQAREVYVEKLQNTGQGPRDVLRNLLGKSHPELAHLTSLKKLLINNNNVYCLGFVPEDDLESVYKLAEVYCQPSYYEGFGFPVLVAMSVNCPVIISKTNALVEIAGDAALIVNPTDPNNMASAITKATTDANLRAQLVRAGEKRVKDFSWEKCAKQTVDLYKKVINGH